MKVIKTKLKISDFKNDPRDLIKLSSGFFSKINRKEPGSSKMLKKPNLASIPSIIGGARVSTDLSIEEQIPDEDQFSDEEPLSSDDDEDQFSDEEQLSSDDDDEESLSYDEEELPEFDVPIGVEELVVTGTAVTTIEEVRTKESHENYSLNPKDLIENLETTLDPMEVSVFVDLLVNSDFTLKNVEEYTKYLTQTRLNDAYVPKKQADKLMFNQQWLQAVMKLSEPLPKEDSQSFWDQLETFDERGQKNPISTRNIVEELRAFPEPQKSYIENGQNNNVIRRIGDKKKFEKRQLRELGPVGLNVLGSSNLTEVSYQTGRLKWYELNGYPIREGQIDYLINVSERNPENIPSISGTRLQLVGYYKLPIGFQPKSFYSNFWLGDPVRQINSDVDDDQPDTPQTTITESRVQRISLNELQNAFDQIVPKTASEMWQMFPEVLNNSTFHDLKQAEGLLKYFNINLKWLTGENMVEWSLLTQEKSDQNSFSQEVMDKTQEEYLKFLQKPKNTNYYPLLKEITNVIELPFYLVWRQAFDQLGQGEKFILDRQKQHYERYNGDLNNLWTGDLQRRLQRLPSTKDTLASLSKPSDKRYRSLIIKFPEDPNIETLSEAEIWINKLLGYQNRDYYQMMRQLESLKRLEKIRDSLENISETVNKGLSTVKQDQQTLAIENTYYRFQTSLKSVDLIAIAGKLERKPRIARSPELVNIKRAVRHMPEFERLSYLSRVLRQFQLDTETGTIRDDQGNYICCVHVLARIEMGPDAMLREYSISQEDTHCVYCGAQLGLPKYDDEEEYENGRREITHSIIFYQENDLEKLKKKDELTKFASDRFLKTLEMSVEELPDTLIYKFLSDFQKDVPEQLGLIGAKQDQSLFLKPDIDTYQYLKSVEDEDVENITSRWGDILSELESLQRIQKDEDKWVILLDSLENHFKKVYLSHLIYVARMAFLTVLLVKTTWLEQPDRLRQEDLDDLTQNNFLKSIVGELVSKASETGNQINPNIVLLQSYNPKHQTKAPFISNKKDDLSTELKDLSKLTNEELVEMVNSLPLLPIDKLIETDQLTTGNPDLPEDLPNWTQDYWVEVYQKLVKIYLERLVDVDQLRPALEMKQKKLKKPDIINQTDIISDKLHEETSKGSLAYCRYYQQQRYQKLSKLYALFDQMTTMIRVLTTVVQRHSCFGGTKLKCPINDRYYYINRLILGEVPIDELGQLFQIINQYGLKSEFPQFQEAFLKLLPKTSDSAETPEISRNISKDEQNLLEEIYKNFTDLEEIKQIARECRYVDRVIFDAIFKGPPREVRAIEYPLIYEFLQTDNNDKSSYLDYEILPETPIIEVDPKIGDLIIDLSNKANENFSQLVKNNKNKNLMELALKNNLLDRRTLQQFEQLPNEMRSPTEYFEELGKIPLITRKDETAIYEKNFPKVTPNAFFLWRRSQKEPGSYSDDLARWLSLINEDQKVLTFWEEQARLSPPEYNYCIMNELKKGPTEQAWNRIQQLVLYIETFRFYLILFKNSIIYPRTDGVTVLSPYMQKLLEEVNEGEMQSFFQNDGVPPEILEYKRYQEVKPENVITFITTDEQIDLMLQELQRLDQKLQTDNVDQATKLLKENIWSIIDCLDPEKYQNLSSLDQDENYQKTLEQMQINLKYILLDDIMRNYDQVKKKTDEKYYVKLVQMIWLVIDQMENTHNVSSEYIDLSIKYHFFQFYEKLRTEMKRQNKTTVADDIDMMKVLSNVPDSFDGEALVEPENGEYANDEDEYGDDEKDEDKDNDVL